MAQFFDAKARQPDALVFFRMGDFYELFFEDAVKAAAAIGITLTAPRHARRPADPDGRRAGARRRGLSRQADPRRLQGRGLRADGGPGRGPEARRQVDRPPRRGAGGDARHPDRGRPAGRARRQPAGRRGGARRPGGGGQRRAFHRRGGVLRARPRGAGLGAGGAGALGDPGPRPPVRRRRRSARR